jgi:hypothetical protein
MAHDFSLVPNRDGSSYFLKREGEQGSMEFISFTAALSYARSCPASVQSKVVLFDAFGRETMRFPAKISEKTFAASAGCGG